MTTSSSQKTQTNEDPDFPFKDVAELRFIAENATSEDDEYIDDLAAWYRSTN